MSPAVDDIRVCIDRIAQPRAANERMALVRDSLWQRGDGIRIAFMDGDPLTQARVRTVAKEWLQYAQLQFFFRPDPAAEIRISFDQKGSWSFIGTQCRDIPTNQPTMNFGWLTPFSPDSEVRRVVLHEFGHALGCIHEHQNPDGGIKWNKEAVYAYYAGPPNNWTRDQVDENLFKTYDENRLTHTPVDGQSIMMYPIDPHFTLDGFSANLNTDLSDTDKAFIGRTYG
jgi:hypothetical protein